MSRTYPGWDASYRSCLCLLLAIVVLTGVIIIISILVPTKTKDHVPLSPENLDLILYKNIMQDQKAGKLSKGTSATTTALIRNTTHTTAAPKISEEIGTQIMSSYTTENETGEKLLHTTILILKKFIFSENPLVITTADEKDYEHSEIQVIKQTAELVATTIQPTVQAKIYGASFTGETTKPTTESSNTAKIQDPAVDVNQTAGTELITKFESDIATTEYTSLISPPSQSHFLQRNTIPGLNNSKEETEPLPETESHVGGKNIFEQKTIIKERSIERDCPKPLPVCSTNSCKKSANEMLALMDHSVDPCNDFYQYACNGLNNNRMKDRNSDEIVLEGIKGILSMSDDPLIRKFKELYDSCAHFSEDNYFFLRDFIEDTFSDKKYYGLSEEDALTELISTILLLNPTASNLRFLPLFDLIVDLDFTGSFVPTLTIPLESPLQIMLNSIDPYENDCLRRISRKEINEVIANNAYELLTSCFLDIGPYIINLNTTLYDLGVFEYLPKLNRSQKIIDIEQSVQFDIYEAIGGLSKRALREQLQLEKDKFVYMGTDQLQIQYPQINWKKLLSNLFPERFNRVEKVRVLFKDVLDKIFTFFRINSFTNIKTFLMAMFLHDLRMEVKAVENRCNTENHCLKVSMNLMEDVAAHFLASKINKKELSLLDEFITNMFNQIKEKFSDFLQSTGWLNEFQKAILFQKLNRIKINSNAYNPYFNEGELSYRNSNLTFSTNFAENLIKLKKNKRRIMYERLINNPGSVWVYIYNPLKNEIFTVVDRNEIVIPIKVLSKYALKRHQYLRDYEIYAKLGYEISKSILTFFIPFYIFKIIPDLKQNEELKNFLEMELSDPPIIKFQNIFGLSLTKEDIKLTNEERFSDDGALQLTYESFRNIFGDKNDPLIWLNLTDSQLFFISFAQSFCHRLKTIPELVKNIEEEWNLPDYFRVNSVIMNYAAFSKNFNCRSGTPMNPEFKVNHFPNIEQAEIMYDKAEDAIENT